MAPSKAWAQWNAESLVAVPLGDGDVRQALAVVTAVEGSLALVGCSTRSGAVPSASVVPGLH